MKLDFEDKCICGAAFTGTAEDQVAVGFMRTRHAQFISEHAQCVARTHQDRIENKADLLKAMLTDNDFLLALWGAMLELTENGLSPTMSGPPTTPPWRSFTSPVRLTTSSSSSSANPDPHNPHITIDLIAKTIEELGVKKPNAAQLKAIAEQIDREIMGIGPKADPLIAKTGAKVPVMPPPPPPTTKPPKREKTERHTLVTQIDLGPTKGLDGYADRYISFEVWLRSDRAHELVPMNGATPTVLEIEEAQRVFTVRQQRLAVLSDAEQAAVVALEEAERARRQRGKRAGATKIGGKIKGDQTTHRPKILRSQGRGR